MHELCPRDQFSLTLVTEAWAVFILNSALGITNRSALLPGGGGGGMEHSLVERGSGGTPPDNLF